MERYEQGGGKLLIVDDMPINLELLEMMLLAQGYEITAETSGQGALDTAPTLMPDLILLDVMMPGLNGYETCRRLKTQETTRDIPVIFITAKTEIRDVVQGFEVGAVDYITKPIQQQEVLARVRTHLRTQSLLQVQRKQLVQAERLAILGQMLGECAHEVATPIGVCGTAWSYLEEQTTLLLKALGNNTLKKTALTKFLANCQESCRIGHSSIQRAHELMLGFKQVAVDQCAEERRTFDVKSYFEQILVTLRPKFKGTSHQITLICPTGITIHSCPGVYFQILTNLILNSLVHAYGKGDAGLLQIEVLSTKSKSLDIVYRDNGRGIPKEDLENIFQRYFTTRREQGGSGLGLYIVHDLVTNVLKGTLICRSVLGEGVEFRLTIPQHSLL